MTIYHITCNTDDNYSQHCCAMLCSLFENNFDSTFWVHILTHSLSPDNTKSITDLCNRYNNLITFYEVDESKLEGVKFRKRKPLTLAAYYRILLPDIISNDIQKILYIDCDIIVLNSIIDIFDVNIDNYALAACIDACPYTSNHRTQLGLGLNDNAFCSGFMLINLRYWRENDAIKKLLEFSKRDRQPIYLHDQDSLNFVFRKQWLELPPKWNRGVMSFFQIQPGERWFDFEEYDQTPKLIHYATNHAKPWYDVKFPEQHYYRRYLKISGYHNIVFEKISTKQKMAVYKAATIYYANKYLHPWIPNIVEILIRDILDFILLLYYLITSHSKFKKKILARRISQFHK